MRKLFAIALAVAVLPVAGHAIEPTDNTARAAHLAGTGLRVPIHLEPQR
jgi:hypothetical protein